MHDGLLHLVQHLPDLHLLLLHFLRRVLLGSQGSCQLLNLLFHLIPSVLLLAALKAPISASVLPMGPTKSSPSAGASYRNVLGDPAFSAVFFETVCQPSAIYSCIFGFVFFWAVANHKDLPVFKRMALEFRVAQSIIYENFTLQTLTSTGRTLLYQSFGDRNVQSRKKGF